MFGDIRQLTILLRTAMFHALGISDRRRWERFEFVGDWNLRLQKIAELVPAGSGVVEFGAGPVGLRQFLAEDCELFSSDVIARDHISAIIDLNRLPLPSLAGIRTDVAVYSGVLEYVSELQPIAEWTARNFNICIASYESGAACSSVMQRVGAAVRRLHMGWVNHLTEPQFIELFVSSGFDLIEKVTWGPDDPGDIYVFHRSKIKMHHSI